MAKVEQKTNENRLAKKIQTSLAGKASAQVTVKATLTGPAAEVWVSDMVDPCTGTTKTPYAYNAAAYPYSACLKADAKIYSVGGTVSIAPMTIPRSYHTMTKLADGRVLIAGGYQSVSFNATPMQADPVSGIYEPNTQFTATSSAEIFDPATGLFTPTGSMNDARALHAAILLPTGKVLIVGGTRPVGLNAFTYPTTTELYDPDTGTFSVMDHLGYGIEEPKLVLEPDGGVFMMGTIQGIAAGSVPIVTSEQFRGVLPVANTSGAQNGTTTTLEMLPQPWIEIDGGRSEFWISANSANSDGPVMPEIPAKVKGISDIQNRNVTWEAQVFYNTGQWASKNLWDSFSSISRGDRFPVASQIFTDGTNPVMRGGTIRLTVKIKSSSGKEVIGGLAKGPLEIHVFARNPGVAKADEWLSMDGLTLNVPPVEANSSTTTMSIPGCTLTDWIRAIARQESVNTMRQFIEADETRRKFWVVGEPRMNYGSINSAGKKLGGDGGMGMMQITNNNSDPSTGGYSNITRFNLLWDWSKNADRGMTMFAIFVSSAKNLASHVRTSPVFNDILNQTNAYRFLTGLPNLDAIYVRDLTMDEIIREAVRGYNGYGPLHWGFYPFLYPNQPEHEYRLKNAFIGWGPNLPFLYTTNERVLPQPDGRRIADAIWETVPADERAVSGEPDYVNKVFAKKQLLTSTCN